MKMTQIKYCNDLSSGESVNVELNAEITKEDIFHYSYAVLHNPNYKKKYEQNLKRDFPRMPFYNDFFQWADWGKILMKLHIDYEEVNPFGLEVFTTHRKEVVKLKADKILGEINIDDRTILKGIPAEAWEYKLGNRSALEWVLNQYKESKPSDPTILEKFNTYRFTDYKEQVIDLLQRVCTVSVETIKIKNDMKHEPETKEDFEKIVWEDLPISIERKLRGIATKLILEYERNGIDIHDQRLHNEIDDRFNKVVSEYLDEIEAF